MKKNNIFKYLLSILLLVIVVPITVLAKGKITLDVDKTDLEVGDTITVTAKVSENTDLYALSAVLSYDENVFAPIDTESFILAHDALSIMYNPLNNKFGIINKAGKINKELFKVELQVKDNANVGKTEIGLTNITSSSGEKVENYDKEVVSLYVSRDAKEGEEIPTNKPYEVVEDKENVNKTFAMKTLIIAIAVLVSLMLVCAIYITITKKDKKNLIVGVAVTTGIVLVTFIVILIFASNKKDVNKDGHKDYDDAKDIMEYLLDIEGTKKDTNSNVSKPSSNKKPNNNFDYDVNNDGKVDIGDVGSSTEDVTQETNYKVKLIERNVNDIYVNKGSITLEFDAEVSPNEDLSEIRIDGVWTPVIKSNTHYNVILDTPLEAGVHDFKITEVKLINGREIKAKLTITKEILKDAPYVDMFNINDTENSLNFRLEDKDNAFISGTVVVTDPSGEDIISEKVEEENHFTYKFLKDTSYNIVVKATYDLDSDKLNDITGEQNVYEDKIIYHHDFTISNDYDFKITNVGISDAISKDEDLEITFDSTNNNGYDVEYIVVNNTEYDIAEKKDNHYKVILKGYDTSTFGRFELNIDKVVLDNLKEFDRDKDYTLNPLTYTVLKHNPVVDNIKLTEDKDNQAIKVSYNLQDEDQTLDNLTVVLVDSNDKIIEKLEDVKEDNLSLSYKGTKDGRYTVKFLGTVNLGTERHIYQDKKLGEESILTQQDIYITDVLVTNVYPVKGEAKYKITYKLYVADYIKKYSNNRSYNTLSAVTINGLNYNAERASGEFTSNVSFTIPKEAGVVDIVATRVQLQYEDYNNNAREYFSIAPYKTQIDVLKDKPSIENLRILEEDYDKGSVTMSFDVKEDKGGFMAGQVKLGDESKGIVVGNNKVTFENAKKDTKTSLKFFADYDLDSNMLPNESPEKNKHYNEEIYSTEYTLIDNKVYDKITLTNVNSTKKYYEKHESIGLNFNIEGLDSTYNLEVVKVIIRDKEYEVTLTENGYNVLVDGFTSSGVKDLTIKDIILNNGKQITLKEPKTLEIEVLKTAVSIDNYSYDIKDKEINLNITVKDADHSVNKDEDIRVEVYNEDNELITKMPYQDKLTIKKDDNTLRYYVKVLASYDRDITLKGENYYENKEILNEVISLEKNYIDLKDITNVTLYKEEDDKVKEISEVNVNDIKDNVKDYYLEITLNEMPSIRSKIKKVLIENDSLVLVLESKYITKDSEDGAKVVFGKIVNGIATNEAKPETFASFIQRIKADPKGEYVLKSNLDAEGISISEEAYIPEFKGTLDGNGYTIKNLAYPLFDKVDGATITNLKIERANLVTTTAHGVLANSINKSTISNVLIDIVSKKDSAGVFGSIGGTIEGSTIENVKASGLSIGIAGTNQQIGGIAGVLRNSTIKNSYANGTFTGGWNYRGGLVGNITAPSTIENCYSKVSITSGYDGNLACGIACGGEGKFINNVSLSTGGIVNKIASGYKESENNYYLGSKTDVSENTVGMNAITENEVNKTLFETKAKFNGDVWNLKDISINNLPSLNSEKVSKINTAEVKDIYDPNKEMLYNNLALLMPFYDSEKIVKSGENIEVDNILNTEEIEHIVPVDETGNVVTYLTTDKPNKIVKIKVVFKNGEKRKYDVRYENTFDMIASYRISYLKVDYTFNHYIIDSNSQLVNNLTNYLAGLKYEDSLDTLTPSVDSRLYKEFYHDVTQNELKEFVLKYLSNSNYTNTSSDRVINDYLEREIKASGKLEKALYVYNYFRRFYSLSIDGIMLNDLVLFNSTGFSKELTIDGIASEYLANEANFNTNGTSDAYDRTLYKYTKIKTIPKFLEYWVKGVGSENVADWYANSYKGLLREVKVTDRDDILYRLWDHISYEDSNHAVWFNYALPLLTLPENSSYIISTPTQFLIGSLRTYMVNPNDPGEMDKFINEKLNVYLARMQDYFDTAASILISEKYFNEIHGIQVDKRYTYDENGNYMFQTPYITQEPFHKNFNEVVGVWAHADGNAATSNGTFIFWRAYAALDSYWTFGTWSHETAHNVDARLFLKNNGRRYDAGGEDYADGNLTQRFYDGDIIMNLSFHYNPGESIASNLVPDRIKGPQKVQDFYRKLFETLYIMDYLEAKAFLTLTPAEQAALAVQASYPNEDQYPDEKDIRLRYKYTLYQSLNEEAFKTMGLKSLENLYDNHLVIYPGIIYSTIGDNRYGGENILKARWYQPHNDYGRPDSYSLKWFAYEMLGLKGYDEGYIEYYSNIHANADGTKNDLMALRRILGDETATFKSYKLGRFEEVAKNIQYVQYIDINETYNKILNALKTDAAFVIAEEKRAWETYPVEDDTSKTNRNNIISSARAYKNREDVRKNIFYTLKNSTNDFVLEVYDTSKTQAITAFSTTEN